MHKSFPDKATYKNWVSAIWARASGLGLSELDVRMIAEQVSGKPSISAMSRGQFEAWHTRVDEMYGPQTGWSKPRPAGSNGKGKVERHPVMATPEQMGFILSFARNDLRWKRGWNERGTECVSITKIIKRHTKGRKQYIDELTVKEARSVIETLKSICRRKKGEAR